MRFRSVFLKGVCATEAEASQRLELPGELVIVERGSPRLMVMNCPDGCGDTLRLNLDKRVGKAWRLYRDEDGLSLYPSVWRDTGCRSHFIIWGNGIYWNDRSDADYLRVNDKELRALVLSQLRLDSFKSSEEIADPLEIVPWTVGRVADEMVSEGAIEVLIDNQSRKYRLLSERRSGQASQSNGF